MKEALSATRVALGDDAVILASESTRDGRVVVRAAPNGAEFAPPPVNLASFETRYRDSLIARLRAKPSAVTLNQEPFKRATLLGLLNAHRVPPPLADTLAQDAEESELPDLCLALAAALDKSMRIQPLDVRNEAALLLVGAYGAGKTTVVAKLAASARLSDRDVRVVATDVDSAGQRERLETFAAHLNVSMLAAPEPQLFAGAAAVARADGALFIADSAGFDPRNPSREILSFVAMESAEIVGVVSATMDAEDALEIAAGLKRLGAKRLIVTGLDLARRKGALARLAASGLAIAQVTASPYLAQGLDTLTPLQLARFLLGPIDGQASEA
jgi:flagellar biosynthesis protein FlhF